MTMFNLFVVNKNTKRIPVSLLIIVLALNQTCSLKILSDSEM